MQLYIYTYTYCLSCYPLPGLGPCSPRVLVPDSRVAHDMSLAHVTSIGAQWAINKQYDR